jgi:Ca2+/Na+ antiporter
MITISISLSRGSGISASPDFALFHSTQGVLMTNVSIIRSVVVLLAIFVIGLLAGVMLGVAMEQQTAQKLPEAAWTLRQQNDDALFRKVMPFTFITMMLLLITSIFLLHGRSRMVMVAATVAALAVIIVTAGWEVPINNEIVKWTPGNAPADWTSTRDKWLHNHWVRTWIGILAFGCALASTLLITD